MRSSRRCSPRAGTLLLALGLIAGPLLAGCGAGSTAAPTATIPTISGAWVRPPLGADRPAAGYLSIRNPGPQADALVKVTSPIATSVELHETMMDSSGMSGMSPITRLDIPAGGTVTLEPGGYHLMLMGVTSLTVGTKVELRLQFEHAGTVVVQAEVKGG